MTEASVTDLGRGRRERHAAKLEAARGEIAEIRARYPNRSDDWLSPGDFALRRRPVPVHAGDPAPVQWDPRRGAFRRRGPLFRNDLLTWAAFALAIAVAVFAGLARMQGLV